MSLEEISHIINELIARIEELRDMKAKIEEEIEALSHKLKKEIVRYIFELVKESGKNEWLVVRLPPEEKVMNLNAYTNGRRLITGIGISMYKEENHKGVWYEVYGLYTEDAEELKGYVLEKTTTLPDDSTINEFYVVPYSDIILLEIRIPQLWEDIIYQKEYHPEPELFEIIDEEIKKARHYEY